MRKKGASRHVSPFAERFARRAAGLVEFRAETCSATPSRTAAGCGIRRRELWREG